MRNRYSRSAKGGALVLMSSHGKVGRIAGHANKRRDLNMWPLYRGILSLIDLPEELKQVIRDAVAEEISADVGDSRKTVKRLLPLFDGVDICWPYDAEVFDNRYTTQEQRLERLYAQALMETYGYRRYQRMLDCVNHSPWWRLIHVEDSRTPKGCMQQKKGLVLHHTDPFWSQGPVFCEREGCRCRLGALSERQYQRLKDKS